LFTVENRNSAVDGTLSEQNQTGGTPEAMDVDVKEEIISPASDVKKIYLDSYDCYIILI